MLNYISKIFFTVYTYSFYLANAVSYKCLETNNFPWYLLYLLTTRLGCITEASTFLCMSMAKVILNIRADVYVTLNSSFTVNMATLFVIVYNFIDFCIRINMHVFDECSDDRVLGYYQYELQRKFCTPETSNHAENSTLCEIYAYTENVYPIGCKVCLSYPTIRILVSSIFIMEIIKFFLGFVRIAKKYGEKFKKNKTIPIKMQNIITTGITGNNLSYNKPNTVNESFTACSIEIFEVETNLPDNKSTDLCKLYPENIEKHSPPFGIKFTNKDLR